MKMTTKNKDIHKCLSGTFVCINIILVAILSPKPPQYGLDFTMEYIDSGKTKVNNCIRMHIIVSLLSQGSTRCGLLHQTKHLARSVREILLWTG